MASFFFFQLRLTSVNKYYDFVIKMKGYFSNVHAEELEKRNPDGLTWPQLSKDRNRLSKLGVGHRAKGGNK